MDALRIAKQLKQEINQRVVQNLKLKDADGFAFLTNQAIGNPMPFEFARQYGFKLPVFIIKDEDSDYIEGIEAVWVKEGLC